MHEPARRLVVAEIKAITEKPETAPVIIFYAVIISCLLTVSSPPLRRNTFWPFRADNPMSNSSPAKNTGRPFRHFGNDIDQLRQAQEPQGTWHGATHHGSAMLLRVHLPALHGRRNAIECRDIGNGTLRNMARSRFQPQNTLTA